MTTTVGQLVTNAEADRAVMRQMQTEIQQIWQYLLSPRPNGFSLRFSYRLRNKTAGIRQL